LFVGHYHKWPMHPNVVATLTKLIVMLHQHTLNKWFGSTTWFKWKEDKDKMKHYEEMIGGAQVVDEDYEESVHQLYWVAWDW
jgi:hypothetical protein